jgi:hypothetical protein
VSSEQSSRTAAEIQADLAARRQSLAATVDELSYRFQPSTIKHRAAVGAVAFFKEPNTGQIRWGRVAIVAGGAALLLAGIMRR